MAIKYVCQFKTLFKCQQAMKCTQTFKPYSNKAFYCKYWTGIRYADKFVLFYGNYALIISN